jgi:DNA-binding PadR family transcriptional regulator
MSLKYGLLGLLGYGKMTGYELDRAFKDSLEFFWRVQTSQVYRELAAMEKDGWLSSEIEVQTGKPNRKIYAITERGRAAFMEWLAASDEAAADALHLRSAFLMRLFFSGELPPEETAAMLRLFRDKCRKALAGMAPVLDSIERCKGLIPSPGKSGAWRMVALFGKRYYEACDAWASEMIDILSRRKTRRM